MPNKKQPSTMRRIQAPPTGAYLAALSRSRWSVDNVAYHWYRGEPYRSPGSAISTDGRNVYSYWHRIGETSPSGKKIAFLCGYSVTTRRHTNSIARVADIVTECEEHPGR